MKTTRQHEASGLGTALTGEQDFGLRIKAIRQARELTLEQVAELSSVSISTLSKIEKGQVSASFDTIAKIASAFDYSLAELFTDELSGQPVISTAIQGRRTYTLAGKGLTFTNPFFRYEVHAAELLVKGMIPVIMGIETRELPPHEAWSQHAGEEFIYVLSGEVMLHTQLYAPLRLAKGDSAYIDSTMRHTFVRLSEDAASLISICQTAKLEIEDLARVNN